MSRTTQPSVAGRFANRSIASWASARSPSAPRSSSVSTRMPVPKTPNAEPSCLVQLVHGFAHHRNGSIAVAAPGLFGGGQQLGDRDQVRSTLALPVANLHHDLQPAVTVGRGVPIQQRGTQHVFGQAQRVIVARPVGRSAPPPRSRAPRSHRPEVPRNLSPDRRSRRRRGHWLSDRCFGPSRRRRGGPAATRDGPATTERRRALPTPSPAVIRYRRRRPWWGRPRPGR